MVVTAGLSVQAVLLPCRINLYSTVSSGFGSTISAGMDAEIKRAKWKDYRLRFFTEECEEVQK